ncbi:MAG: hypothetical protein EAZ91_05925 [Cytophagales bacterium]|nr:MAG: hypothetical protein EAZ91_05925 [Cytophagales bacterium]
MPLLTLSTRRSELVLITTASDAVNLPPVIHRDPNGFLTAIAVQQPIYTLITGEFARNTTLFSGIRHHAPQTQLILCLTPETLAEAGCPWALLDQLDLDTLCLLDELPECLKTLTNGRTYRSSLLAMPPNRPTNKELPGWKDLKGSEKRIIQLILDGLDGPAIAERLHISRHTLRNEKVIISQKLGMKGNGPGSLIRFVLLNAAIIRQLLAQ